MATWDDWAQTGQRFGNVTTPTWWLTTVSQKVGDAAAIIGADVSISGAREYINTGELPSDGAFNAHLDDDLNAGSVPAVEAPTEPTGNGYARKVLVGTAGAVGVGVVGAGALALLAGSKKSKRRRKKRKR